MLDWTPRHPAALRRLELFFIESLLCAGYFVNLILSSTPRGNCYRGEEIGAQKVYRTC